MGNFQFHKAHFLCTTSSRRRVSLGRYVHTVGDTYKDDDWVFWASRATLVEEALSLSLLSFSLSLSAVIIDTVRFRFSGVFLRDLHAVVAAETSPVYSETDLLDSYFMHCLVDNALCRVAVEMKCCLQWIRPRCLVCKSVFPGTSLGWI